jgi:hypothetical protein
MEIPVCTQGCPTPLELLGSVQGMGGTSGFHQAQLVHLEFPQYGAGYEVPNYLPHGSYNVTENYHYVPGFGHYVESDIYGAKC